MGVPELTLVLGSLTTIVLFFLALVHFYWAMISSSQPSAKVVPYIDGKPAFIPTRKGTAFVAFLLLLMGLFLVELTYNAFGLSLWFNKLGGTVLAGGFIARAVGDFRLVGAFKRVKNSEFAFYDTHYWSPLCAALGLAVLLITWAH